MEIAGYPHYENVCSNVLAFFIDPAESHGFGRLVLDALLHVLEGTETANAIGGNVSVEREVTTEKGRIDILITSDDHAILIENKIFASVGNPFDDYASYLDRTANDRTQRKILLTLSPSTEGSDWGFTNLTHEEFVVQIRSLLGRYVSNADARYLTIFLDFLNTLESLRRGSRMDQEFVEFLARRGDDVRDLFNDLKNLRADMRGKVEELRDLVVWDQYASVEREGVWRGDTIAMFDNLFHHIRVAEDLLVGVDTHLDPQGWEIQIYPRDRGNPVKLTNLLDELGISFEQSRSWRLYAHPTRFAYDERPDRIRPILQEVIDALATKQERDNAVAPV